MHSHRDAHPESIFSLLTSQQWLRGCFKGDLPQIWPRQALGWPPSSREPMWYVLVLRSSPRIYARDRNPHMSGAYEAHTKPCLPIIAVIGDQIYLWLQNFKNHDVGLYEADEYFDSSWLHGCGEPSQRTWFACSKFEAAQTVKYTAIHFRMIRANAIRLSVRKIIFVNNIHNLW